MLYLAWKIYKSTAPTDSPTKIAQEGLSFLTGFTLQFVNMKIIIFCITVMGSYILPHFSAPLLLTGFVVLLALSCFCATISWTLFGALFSELLARRQKLINTILALLLVYCAISLFL